MILLPCAWCGPRDATEFAHVGEVTARPDPGGATPAQWRGYLYLRANPCGWTRETWYHRMGCRRYITVERHTETNEVRAVSAAAPMPPQAPGHGANWRASGTTQRQRCPGAEDQPPALPHGAPPARPSEVLPDEPPARRTAREAG